MKETMEKALENLYRNVAERLLEAIDGRDYFNGAVQVEEEEGEGVLTCSLIIYRACVEDMTGKCDLITDIVPVWWEYASYGPDGLRPNDFSWNELHAYLMSMK